MYMFLFIRPALKIVYFFGEKDELAQDGHSLKILSESPPIISDYRFIQIRMEENSNYGRKCDQVITLNDIHILIIASLEFIKDCIKNESSEADCEYLLNFENGVS